MARIVSVHFVDKEAFLKGNLDGDPDVVVMVFDHSPTYAEVADKVREQLKWNDPTYLVKLDKVREQLEWNDPSSASNIVSHMT
jgi:hypothetical protein